MHILIISEFLSPKSRKMSALALTHLQYWLHSGHWVTIITNRPPKGNSGYSKNFFQYTDYPKCNVIYAKTIQKSKNYNRSVRNAIDTGLLAIHAFSNGLYIKKCDLIIGAVPSLFIGFIGLVLAKLRSASYISEIHERMQSRGGFFMYFIRKAIRYLEDFLFTHSDHLVLSKEGNAVDLSRFPDIPRTTIPVIFNILRYTQIESIKDDKILIEKGSFKVCYIGELTREHYLDNVLLSAKTIQELHDIHYYLIGDGNHRNFLEDRIKNEKITNISIYGEQSEENIVSILEHMDIIIFLGKSKVSKKSPTPCGLLKAMAMKKPIIIGMPGKPQQIIAQSNAGIVIQPDSVTDLRNAVLKLYHRPSVRRKLGCNGQKYVINNFPSEDLDASFAHLRKQNV